MKFCLVALFLLSSCSPVRNTIDVDIAASPGAAATLTLCGKDTPLGRKGERLRATIPITCEGRGEVHVRLGDGGEATCIVGYVTPGLAQDFRFKVRDGRCA